jgi:hypothetical protein
MKLGLRRIKGPTLTLSVVLEISKMTPYNYQQIMCDKSIVKVQYAVRSVGNAGSIILFPQISPLIIFLSQLL